MIIKDSSITMSSARDFSAFSYTNSRTREVRADVAATLEFSAEAKGSYMEQLDRQISHSKRLQEEGQRKNEQNSLNRMMEQMRLQKQSAESNQDLDNEYVDNMIRLLRQILAALRGEKYEDTPPRRINVDQNELKAMTASFKANYNMSLSASASISAVDLRSPGTTGGTLWTRITADQTTAWEKEDTVFSSTGVVHTSDGREINFGAELKMSRSFASISQSISTENYIVTDPLIFNAGNNVSTISDKKFRFDIDCDGKEDEISYATGNSGFLALDKNGDGKINDGSELFGTKSGDGFADLSEYDSDGNGWIDEADEVYNHLLIWQKDDNGNDNLISLKDFGVGAIYLSNVDTEFSLNNQTGNTANGIIRKTGIYLKENGDVGTVQHVDLVL